MSNTLATNLESLKAYRDNLITELATAQAEIVASGKPKPSYSLDGQAVDWIAYRKGMREEIQETSKFIAELSWATGPVNEIQRA